MTLHFYESPDQHQQFVLGILIVRTCRASFSHAACLECSRVVICGLSTCMTLLFLFVHKCSFMLADNVNHRVLNWTLSVLLDDNHMISCPCLPSISDTSCDLLKYIVSLMFYQCPDPCQLSEGLGFSSCVLWYLWPCFLLIWNTGNGSVLNRKTHPHSPCQSIELWHVRTKFSNL